MTTARSILQITLRHGIWRIWLDGKFFGDYRSKSEAIEAAEAAQRATAAVGRVADIVVKPETSLAQTMPGRGRASAQRISSMKNISGALSALPASSRPSRVSAIAISSQLR